MRTPDVLARGAALAAALLLLGCPDDAATRSSDRDANADDLVFQPLDIPAPTGDVEADAAAADLSAADSVEGPDVPTAGDASDTEEISDGAADIPEDIALDVPDDIVLDVPDDIVFDVPDHIVFDVPDVADDSSTDVLDAEDPGLVAVDPPEPPTASAQVQVVTVTIASGNDPYNGTSDAVEVCLGDQVCFPFTIDEVLTTERGALTVLHHDVSAAGLDPAAVDFVSVRILGDNAWRPTCLDVRLDGRPAQCADLTGTVLSSDPSEAPSDTWQGPFEEACTTCQAGLLTHGAVLGLPSEDTVRVWARADATRLVGLELSETVEGPGVPVAWAWPTPATDFSATLVAEDLQPATTYWYRVTVDGQGGAFRPIRTAPLATAEVAIGVGSCADEPEQHPAMFNQLAAKPMDAFLFVGDSHYGNAQNLQAHWHYIRELRVIPERHGFFGGVPVASIWDDHDFVGNNSSSACAGRDEALEAFQSYWPNPSSRDDGVPGIHFSARQGPVELFMLDCRYHRPDVGDAAMGCETDGPGNLDHGAGPLGEAQFTWLLDGLAASEAPFKLVACGSLVSGTSVDSWKSFPEAKERLLSEVHTRGVAGVVFVSGDIHRSEAKVIARDDGYDFVEIVSSPLAQYSHAGSVRTQCDAPVEGRLYCDPYNSFVVVRVDGGAADPELQALFYDEFGDQKFALVRRLSELTNP